VAHDAAVLARKALAKVVTRVEAPAAQPRTDRAARREVLEQLQRLLRAAKPTADGAERVVELAMRCKLDDAPEFLAGRRLMHALKLAEAVAVLDRATKDMPAYKERFDDLTSKCCNRAAFAWKRKLDASLASKTEAASNVLFHERREAADAALLEACLARRRAAGRPDAALDDDDTDEEEVLLVPDDGAAVARRAARRATRRATERVQRDRDAAQRAARDAARAEASERYAVRAAAAASRIAAARVRVVARRRAGAGAPAGAARRREAAAAPGAALGAAPAAGYAHTYVDDGACAAPDQPRAREADARAAPDVAADPLRRPGAGSVAVARTAPPRRVAGPAGRAPRRDVLRALREEARGAAQGHGPPRSRGEDDPRGGAVRRAAGLRRLKDRIN